MEEYWGTTRLGSVFWCFGRERGSKNNSISMNLQVLGENIFRRLFLTGLAQGWRFRYRLLHSLFPRIYFGESQLVQGQLSGNLAGIFFIVGFSLGQ
jgi:hypothetical protein